MNVQSRLYLESKILKYVRQNNAVSITGELSAEGIFLSTITKRMWYFIRKNDITDQDVYKTARRLEDQGFIRITALAGKIYLQPPMPSNELTEERLENLNRDMRSKPQISPEDFRIAQAVAERYKFKRKREQETTQFKEQSKKKIEEEDLNTLEDYLKDE